MSGSDEDNIYSLVKDSLQDMIDNQPEDWFYDIKIYGNILMIFLEINLSFDSISEIENFSKEVVVLSKKIEESVIRTGLKFKSIEYLLENEYSYEIEDEYRSEESIYSGIYAIVNL